MVKLAIHLERTDSDYTEAQITKWFTTAIRQESTRLEWERNRRNIHELSVLNAPSALNEEDRMSELAANENTEVEAEDELFLEEVLALLTVRQRIVILKTVIRDVPEQVVAVELNTSQQAVHRVKARALKRLKHYLSDY